LKAAELSEIDKELKQYQEELDIVEDVDFLQPDQKIESINIVAPEIPIEHVVDLKHEILVQEDYVMKEISLDDVVFVEPEVERKVEEMEDEQNHGNFFYCLFCDDVFDSYASKKEHMKQNHTDENGRVKPVTCGRCNRALPDPFRAKRFEFCLVCQAEKFKCAYCDEKFPTKIMRGAHESMTHTNDIGEMLPLNCKICTEPCKDGIGFRIHFMEKHRKRKENKEQVEYKCPYPTCGKEFKSAGTFYSHKKYVHRENAKKDVYCPIEGCDFVTYNNKLLYDHKNAKHGEKKQQCPDCLRKFRYASQIKYHHCKGTTEARAPLIETPCPVCGQVYRSENVMLSHYQDIHKGMPPGYEHKKQFPCKHCNKVFFSMSSVEQHKRRCASEENQFELKATCKKCNEDFTFPKFVWHYKHIHNGIPPGYEGKQQFECDKCQSIYFSHEALAHHEKYGHKAPTKKYKYNRNPKQCPYCDKMLSDATKLKHHIGNAHTTHSAFHCRVCGKGFGSKPSLYWHEKKTKTCAVVLNSRIPT